MNMNTIFLRTLTLFLAGNLCSGTAGAATFTVNNTADAGAGSLRQAIMDANISPGADQILFNIPLSDPNYNATTGVWVISPLTAYSFITGSGLTIDGSSQTLNQGNTNADGPEIMLNGSSNTVDYAFSIINASDITIKGFIISDFIYGIQIYGTNSRNNRISGNYLGTNHNASDSLGNYIGIEIIGGAKKNIVGGTTVADRNIASGNEHIGIRVVDADSNYIWGNYVGTDREGNYRIGNYDGISVEGTAKNNVIGGNTPAHRNVVSGNYAYGIPFIGNAVFYNEVYGNYIGTNAAGTAAIPNTYGVLFDDGSSYNIVGSNNVGERNIISGNSGYGVFIYNYGTHDNIVEGNYIGTDVTGTMAVPNANGIVVDGAPYRHYIRNNVISGNDQEGIVIHITGSDGHIVTANKIGTDASGMQALGNGTDGIRIGEGPINNIIGGSPAEGNIIAFNLGCGVNILTDDIRKNTVSCNTIYGNGGLGIDLFPAGPNLNDGGDIDAGANDGMNYPVIDSVIFITPQAIIYGTLDALAPEHCRVELFRANPDITGYGEGEVYLGYCIPDAMGNWRDTTVNVFPGNFVTATATDSAGNTSEFSFCYPYPPVSVEEVSGGAVVISTGPNPVNDYLEITLSGDGNFSVPFDLQVYSMRGQLVMVQSIGEMSVRIPVSHLSSGVYQCRIMKTGVMLAVFRITKR